MKRTPFSPKRISVPIHTGAPSILLIFVVLALVSFAALSTLSALADARNGRRVAERTLSYYSACCRMEESLEGLDRELQNAFHESENEMQYLSTVGQSRTFTSPISEYQDLVVMIEPCYPADSQSSLYRIMFWKIVTKEALPFRNNSNFFRR